MMEWLIRTAKLLAMTVPTLVAACATTPPVERVPPALRGEIGEVTVLIFGSVDCPIANAYAPEIERIYEQCLTRSVKMFYVHPTVGVTSADAIKHAQEVRLTVPIALDPDHIIVRAVGATVTPEAAVIRFIEADQFDLVYRGRIDDFYAGIGKRRARASTRELLDAIDAAIDGRVPAVARTTPVGCFIEPAPAGR